MKTMNIFKSLAFFAAAFLLDKVPLRGYNKADGNDRPDQRLRCTK
jgi:hypothetical protein